MYKGYRSKRQFYYAYGKIYGMYFRIKTPDAVVSPSALTASGLIVLVLPPENWAR